MKSKNKKQERRSIPHSESCEDPKCRGNCKKPVKATTPPAPPVKVAPLAPAPRKVNNFDSELTRLQVGDIVDLGVGLGGEHLVWKCNDCRALCMPTGTRSVKFTEQGEFDSAGLKPVGISPNSEVPILRRLGKSGMIEFLENKQKQQSENSMAKDKTTTKKNKSEEDAPRLGRLGGFHGFAITAVIRQMAVAGWEYWEIRQVFDNEKITVADNTIRIQLSAGRAGKGGNPAELTKKLLAELRPDPDDKPAAARVAKSEKKGKKAAVKSAKTKPAADEDEEEEEAPAPKAKKKSKPAPVEDEDEDEEEKDEPAADDGDDE